MSEVLIKIKRTPALKNAGEHAILRCKDAASQLFLTGNSFAVLTDGPDVDASGPFHFPASDRAPESLSWKIMRTLLLVVPDFEIISA